MKYIVSILIIVIVSITNMSFAQTRRQVLTLPTAIRIAQEYSYDAQSARFSFLASYWSYRTFKSELLPSVNLSGSLMNFDHSIVETRNYETGQVNYVDNNTLSNNLTLSVDQQIVATGGKVSLQSYLYRLDQFDYNLRNYNSRPLRLSYTQPLRSFNNLKWEKEIAPINYEVAGRRYLTSMQQIALSTVNYFFNALSAQWEYQQQLTTLRDRELMYKVAERRLQLGTTTKSEVLQLELSLINARVALQKQKMDLDDCLYQLYSYLYVTDYENVELVVPDSVPVIFMDTELVIEKTLDNSSYTLEQKQEIMQAEKNLAQVKAGRGPQMSIYSELGLSKSGHSMAEAYSQIKDNEVVGLTFSLPIFDWGVSKGRVQVAKSQLEVIRTRQAQDIANHLHSLRKKVLEFNLQTTLCRDAERAMEISAERYDIMRRYFEAGSVTVTDLNTAQSEQESARSQYVNQIRSFWTDYYTIQQNTLYDWINGMDIKLSDSQVNSLINKQ